MKRLAIALLASLSLSAPALGNDFAAVRDRDTFLSLISGKELRIALYNLTLKVTPDGRISGNALGWDITGSWSWQDGYFCREMDWSGKEIPYNCQLVETRGQEQLRFTVDRGKGDSATFRLR